MVLKKISSLIKSTCTCRIDSIFALVCCLSKSGDLLSNLTVLFCFLQGRATVYRGCFTSCEQCRTIIDVSTLPCFIYGDAS